MACLRKQRDLTGSARSQGILSIPLPPGNPHAYSTPRQEPAGVRPHWAASPLPELCLLLSGDKRRCARIWDGHRQLSVTDLQLPHLPSRAEDKRASEPERGHPKDEHSQSQVFNSLFPPSHPAIPLGLVLCLSG